MSKDLTLNIGRVFDRILVEELLLKYKTSTKIKNLIKKDIENGFKNLFLDYSNGKNVFEMSMELFKVVDQGKKAKNFGFLSKNEVDFLVQ